MIKKGNNKKRIRGIVYELVSNSLDAGARSVKAEVNSQDEFFEISVEDDGCGMDPQQTKEVEALLLQPRREEFEDYYGGLVGVTGFGSGLTIVGMLVDEAEVKSEEGKGTKVWVKLWHKQSK